MLCDYERLIRITAARKSTCRGEPEYPLLAVWQRIKKQHHFERFTEMAHRPNEFTFVDKPAIVRAVIEKVEGIKDIVCL